MSVDLEATFEAHKAPIIAAAAGGVVLLALAQRRKKGGATSTTTATSATPGGVVYTPASAGGQAAAMTGAAYDSTSTDLYSALSPQLASIGSQLSQLTSQSSSPTPVPAPIASTLYKPSDSSNFVLYTNGTVAQVQSDGSQLGLNYDQWRPLSSQFQPVHLPSAAPVGAYFETAGNLARVGQSAASPTPVPASA